MAYYGDGSNHGLPYAYNYVINTLKMKYTKDRKHLFLTLLDDDTEITKDYLVYMEAAIEKVGEKADIFAPVVMSDDEMISPFNVWKDIKVLAVNDVSKIKNRQISAINSGLVLRLSVFDKVMYDENYFLDCVDHDFFRKVRKYQIPVQIVENARIYQTFSRNENCDKRTRLKRFRIYKKDFKYFSSVSKMGRVFFYLSSIKMAIKYNRQYHTREFFK
ncbi:MAG: hypothetical protein PHW34_14460 [Hespellia sp.]|nr:hypothetical protein [Hespellia sp.]